MVNPMSLVRVARLDAKWRRTKRREGPSRIINRPYGPLYGHSSFPVCGGTIEESKLHSRIYSRSRSVINLQTRPPPSCLLVLRGVENCKRSLSQVLSRITGRVKVGFKFRRTVISARAKYRWPTNFVDLSASASTPLNLSIGGRSFDHARANHTWRL